MTEASGNGAISLNGENAKGGSSLAAVHATTEQYATNSVAMGYGSKTHGKYSVAIGYNAEAHSDYSVAIGSGTKAYSYKEFVVGSTNTSYTPTVSGSIDGTIAWFPADRLFVVGNGSSSGSDALIIYKNGNAEFRGNVYPSNESNVHTLATSYTLGTSTNKWKTVYATNGINNSSDKRLKTDIKPLEKALDKVLTLNGVTYSWRVKEFPEMHFDSERHVGVIAQEVEAVLLEAVETGEDGYKSVNYSNITPLLIEAMKEQQGIINQQQATIEGQNKKIESLEKQMEEMRKMMEELMKK